MEKKVAGRLSRSRNAFRNRSLREGRPYQLNLQRLLAMVIGIGINVLGSYLMFRFNLPLFMDTIGTIAAAAVAGYIYGATTAVMTSVLRSFFAPTSVYFTSISILVAFTSAFFLHNPRLRKKRFVPLLILILALLGGGLGTGIQWLLTGEPCFPEVAQVAGAISTEGTAGYFFFCVLISIGLDIIDKTISCGVAALMVRIIPKKTRFRMWNNSWMQRPMTNKEIHELKEKTKTRRIPFARRIFLMLTISAVLLVTVQSFISMKLYENNIREEYEETAVNASKFVAESVDGDRVDDYLRSGQTVQDCSLIGYQQTLRVMDRARRTFPNVEYLYVYRIEEDGAYLVLDVDPEAQGSELGDKLDFDESFLPYKEELLAGKEIPIVESEDQFGHLITAYHPIYDSSGACVAYAGADVAYADLREYTGIYIFRVLLILIGFFLLIVSTGLWLTKYYMVHPVNTIATYMNEFAVTEVDQKTLDKQVKEFREIRIKTGDEVEFMYEALCRMMTSVAEQMRELRHYTEATTQMQNGLIITMADMVESRDSDTGAHIQKTAAYVRIILDGLKRKGYYAEKLTPKYMSDVVISAPLHDVGKINVPDAVLNKPGKLTDEEYEIIKTHTTAGREIIERAIDTVHGENYLKEARNMAAYHHERWDGKGYPENLHGEVIPLSARVMAVADVFDALTSKRVYKPAFPPEKALQIIEEGSGTQFDPLCVEAFMDSLTEVKIVLKKYSEV